MTKSEMNRLINEMPAHLAARIHSMVLAGHGVHSIALKTTATLEQVNAVLKWVGCYGRIRPQPE